MTGTTEAIWETVRVEGVAERVRLALAATAHLDLAVLEAVVAGRRVLRVGVSNERAYVESYTEWNIVPFLDAVFGSPLMPGWSFKLEREPDSAAFTVDGESRWRVGGFEHLTAREAADVLNALQASEAGR